MMKRKINNFQAKFDLQKSKELKKSHEIIYEIRIVVYNFIFYSILLKVVSH